MNATMRNTTNMKELRSVEQALLERIDELAGYKAKLEMFTPDAVLRRRAGYAALHAAREAAGIVFRDAHPGVQDIAPKLSTRGESFKRSENAARKLIDQVMSGKIELDALTELAEVAGAGRDAFALGVAATNATVALLGLGEYGGVFGAWQVPVLAFDWLTWKEHISLNGKILADALLLDPESMQQAAVEFHLPEPSYLIAGCLGNIVKANYREAMDESSALGARREAMKNGDKALAEIKSRFGAAPSGRQLMNMLLFDTLLAMQAGTRDHLGIHGAGQFWGELGVERATAVVRDVVRTELFAPLVQAVQRSVEQTFSCE